ncbi:MAG: tetratricopeptide repeat protein [Fibrobacterota bacterium]|nr:tetratricopeptide repeat protein [Chitinispirillaceae bacterium]
MCTVFKSLKILLLNFVITGMIHAASDTQSSWIDSAESRYSDAATQYDMDALRTLADLITLKPADEQQTPRALLLYGCVLWRLQLIAFCKMSEADIMRYGKASVKKLNEAEKAGADTYLTASFKALAYQLMAGQGINNGALNGPLAGKELKKAQKANPKGYYSLLVEAINVNQAPSFVGGSPQKAIVLFEKMIPVFPDSIDVKTHLADAYGKAKRKEDAKRLIATVVKEYPANLLARTIAERLNNQ